MNSHKLHWFARSCLKYAARRYALLPHIPFEHFTERRGQYHDTHFALAANNGFAVFDCGGVDKT